MRNLRFILNRVRLRSPFADGPHTVRIIYTVDGNATSESNTDLRNRGAFDPPAPLPECTVDVDARPIESGQPRPVDVSVQVVVDEPGNTTDLGTVTHRVHYPFYPRQYVSSGANFRFRWTIDGPEREDPPADGPAEVCREAVDGNLCSTIGSPDTRIRIEVHEVLPSRDATSVPPRPVFPPGTPQPRIDNRGAGRASILSGRTNTIWNPPVIPILASATEKSAANCAKFRVTWYRPRTLNLLDTGDDRLEWRTVPINGGAADFFGGVDGKKVYLHGREEGEIALELRYRGTLVATYRALVAPLVRIPCRITILNGQTGGANFTVSQTPTQVRNHILAASRFWRQLGIELYMDSSRTIGFSPAHLPANTFVPAMQGGTRVRGVFTATVPDIETRGFLKGTTDTAAYNSRQWVANFVYVKQCNTPATLGRTEFLHEFASATISDSGTPSSSWNLPNGVPPSGDAGTVRMTTFATGTSGARTLAGRPRTYGMFICDNHALGTDGNPDPFEFAGTIAHEFGHVLGLRHRGSNAGTAVAGGDNVVLPAEENLMHPNNSTTQAQDLDIVQARAARQCPLVRHYLP